MNTLAGHIRLDFRSQEPIYLQIVRQVEQLVQDGALRPGDQLPTVRQMAIDLRINYSTVARAYNILDKKRLISTQRGRGTYIWADDYPKDPAAKNHSPATHATDREQFAAKLTRDFLDEALHQGFDLHEIQQAFDREVAKRMSTKELL